MCILNKGTWQDGLVDDKIDVLLSVDVKKSIWPTNVAKHLGVPVNTFCQHGFKGRQIYWAIVGHSKPEGRHQFADVEHTLLKLFNQIWTYLVTITVCSYSYCSSSNNFSNIFLFMLVVIRNVAEFALQLRN